MAIIRSAMLTIRLSSSYVLIITTPSNKTRSGREHVPRQPHRYMRFRGYFEEYLSAAPIHHVGVSRFQTTWTSEVEREALRRAYNANRHRDNSLKTRRFLWPLGSGSCYAPFGSKEMREGHTRQISFCLMGYMDFRCHQSEIGLCHFAILWQIFR